MMEHFTFYRTRNGQETLFYPESARIRFASKEGDRLDLAGLAHGTLATGDTVAVFYESVCRFKGFVASVRRTRPFGTEDRDTAVVQSPWTKMARIVFKQRTYTSGTVWSSTAVLFDNCSLSAQVSQILSYCSSACGFSVGTVSLPAMTPSAEQITDQTCASALEHCLRFVPHAVVSFDYTTTTPTLNVTTVADNAADSAWTSTANVFDRVDEDLGTGIDGVELEYDTVSSSGVSVNVQTAGSTTDPSRTLHATIRLAGAELDSSFKSLTPVVEPVPSDISSPTFWKQYHPALANYAAGDITISGAAHNATTLLGYISSTPVKDLKEAKFNAQLVTYTCKASVTARHGMSANGDPVESISDIALSMVFVNTDATGTTRTWQTGYSAQSAETMPSGLAAAVLAAHARDGQAISISCRLSASVFPKVGDVLSQLQASAVDVDCALNTAAVQFGPVAALDPETMAQVLSGFRARHRSSFSYNRADDDDSDARTEVVEAVMPISTTEFSPGETRSLKMIGTTSSGVTPTVSIDPGAVSGDSVAVELRQVSFLTDYTASTGTLTKKKAWVLCTDPEDSQSDDDDDDVSDCCSDHPGGGEGVSSESTDGSGDGGSGDTGGGAAEGSGGGVSAEDDGSSADGCANQTN